MDHHHHRRLKQKAKSVTWVKVENAERLLTGGRQEGPHVGAAIISDINRYVLLRLIGETYLSWWAEGHQVRC